jgi:hypothetical protein
MGIGAARAGLGVILPQFGDGLLRTSKYRLGILSC